MSLDLNVYVEAIDDHIIPKWINRMNQFDMECTIHPDFSFDNHHGFIPFKIKMNHPKNPTLEGSELISGFEFYLAPFDYQKELDQIQPKKAFFQKILNKQTNTIPYATPEIDARLAHCKWVLTFNWGSHNSLELRMAALSSAIITELTNGVCCYPADDIWYDNKTIVEDAFNETLQYENSLSTNEWKVHEFEGWN